jgi:outer membrane receptor protein involved in Fe transport
LAAPAAARPLQLDIPASDLAQALIAFSRQTGQSVGMAGTLPRHRVRKFSGMIEPGEALARIVRGSGLRVVRSPSGIWRLEPMAGTPSPPPSAAERLPEEIVVSGSKRDENLASIPISVSVLRPDAAERLIAPRGVQDLIAAGEGAFSTNLGPGRDRIFLRGVADSAFNGPTQSTVSLFLDDARVGYATPDPDLRLVDVDHVELLRGPQGTLYGTGALGGIVRIVPRKPDLARWAGFAAVEGNATEHGAPGGAIEAGINAPIRVGRLALRVAGYADRTGGWIDDSGRSKADVNDVRRYGGRASLRWKLAEDWTLDLGATVQWINAADSQYANRGLTRATAIGEPHDNDFLAATATIRGVIADLDLTSSTAFVTHEVTSRFDAGSVSAVRNLPAPLAYDDERDVTLLSQEWRISDPSVARPWVAGVALLRTENGSNGRFTPLGSRAVPVISLHSDAFEAALFGEASQSLGAGLTATIGLRGFLSKVNNEQSGQRRLSARKIGATPSVDLSWHPRGDVLMWLRYASAIRPGGINPDGDPRLSDFRSDDLKSVELGWRLRLGERLRMNGALFGLLWENVQSDSAGVDGLVRTINAGRARNFGIELSSSLDLRPFSVDGNLTVQHARLYRPSPAANAIGDDNRLPVIPDYAGRLRIGYAQRLGAAEAKFFLSARYVGKARLSFDPGIARSMGGYWSSDAGGSLALQGWRVALTLSNLFDGRGNSFGFGNPFSLRLVDQRTPIRPRTLSFRIERNF